MLGNNNSIHIGKVRVVETRQTTRLETDTVMKFDGKEIKETLFYEVEKRWGSYLTPERSDSFVLSLLILAMQKNANIEHETPMTEDLKYGLERYLIPVFSRKIKGMYTFKIIGKTSSEIIPSEKMVGTGFSGGVDSFYTILSHTKTPYHTKKISHLVLAVNGAALTGLDEGTDKKWFEEELNRLTPLAAELGLPLIGINSNIACLNQLRSFLMGGDGITTAGYVYALRKLFSTYYWASGYEADMLEFRRDDACYMEGFFLPLLSIEGLRFYHSGEEVSRVEKVAYISENLVAQKGLTVCGRPRSCGKCAKCTRTMSELYSIGKLDKFSAVFPVDEYKKHLADYLARELAQDHAPFTTDIIDSMHMHKVRIPIVTWLLLLYYKPFFFAKKRLRKNKFFMKLYYEKGWSERLGNGIPDANYAKARLAGRDKI